MRREKWSDFLVELGVAGLFTAGFLFIGVLSSICQAITIAAFMSKHFFFLMNLFQMCILFLELSVLWSSFIIIASGGIARLYLAFM